jgi:NYN domain
VVDREPPRLGLVIDFQNIHLTGGEIFAPYGTPPQDTLIHPLLFAEQVVAARSAAQGDRWQARAVLAGVHVFRGAPSNHHNPRGYSAVQAQKAEWSRDPRVDVTYRTLRYASKPGVPPREKGIDVLVAITFVRLAERRTYDVVVLATHDTDQEPALEMAAQAGGAKVETAGWEGCKRLRIPLQGLWHTTLDAARFVAARDRKPY